MSEGKIRIPALEGTPEEIAAYKRSFHPMQSADWMKQSVPNDRSSYLREAMELANGDPKTEIAINLWHHFAPASSIVWADDSHKSEYLLAVDDITTGQLFNLLVARLNYDGADTASLTLGEIARAVDGAALPRS